MEFKDAYETKDFRVKVAELPHDFEVAVEGFSKPMKYPAGYYLVQYPNGQQNIVSPKKFEENFKII